MVLFKSPLDSLETSPPGATRHPPFREAWLKLGFVYVGWLLHNTRGGLVAGAFFIILSMLILWSLSYIYVACGNLPWIAAIFYGLKPAILAIVAAAVIRIGSRTLKNEVMWTLAAAAFVAIFFVHLPFPLIILSAAAIGFVGGRWKREKFLVIRGHGPGKAESVLDDTRRYLITRNPTGLVRFEWP